MLHPLPMPRSPIVTLAGLLAAALLCHCGAPQPPQCHRVPSASRVPSPTLLAEARTAWKTLANPSRKRDWPAATATYNAAVAKLFDQLRCGNGDWQTRAQALGTRIQAPDKSHLDPAKLDSLFPASLIRPQTISDRKITGGIGVPLVGWKKTAPVGQRREPYTLPTGLPYLITTSLDFSRPGPPAWQMHKRWLVEETAVDSTTHTLAADWSAPNEFFWAMSELDNLTIENVLLPDRFSEETGFYFLQPYDPDKIPVILVHGLVSSPDAFRHTINSLVPEPWFRKNYQIWLYNYPTGNPWSYSAGRFRQLTRELCAYARTKGHSRKLEQMVIIGHSMGGLITHASVTDPGTAFYDEFFNKPIETLPLSEPSREFIRETFLYKPLQEPKRVIFLATPHRGSPMAEFRFALWISRLIRLPKTLTIELLDDTLTTVGGLTKTGAGENSFGTSIGTLSPANRSTVTLGKLPLPKGIVFHSIIGDRGRGGTPNSSDGVVPYWSSHIEPVATETIVPASHSVQNHPATNAEIKWILLHHLEQVSR